MVLSLWDLPHLGDFPHLNLMICSKRPVHIATFALLLGLPEVSLQAQITWEFAEPLDVAESDYGNKCPRLVLDASGNPVVFMGKSNDGLYVVTSENGTFNTPQAIPTDPGIFLSDSEGPDVATWGNTIGLAYQISGQWMTGAQFMRSDDGGLTWSGQTPTPSPPTPPKTTSCPSLLLTTKAIPLLASSWAAGTAQKKVFCALKTEA